jgi:hypothetical protein
MLACQQMRRGQTQSLRHARRTHALGEGAWVLGRFLDLRLAERHPPRPWGRKSSLPKDRVQPKKRLLTAAASATLRTDLSL